MPTGPKGQKRHADTNRNAVLMEMKDIVALIDDADMQATIAKRAALLSVPQSN
jgi:hypothetical protein